MYKILYFRLFDIVSMNLQEYKKYIWDVLSDI